MALLVPPRCPRFSFDAPLPLCQYSRVTGENRLISFRISILASGSAGNCTLLETETTTLLIDAGLGRKEMLRRFEALGRARPDRVDAVLITHEHSDHSTGVAQMAREWHCPAYLTEPTHLEILKMFTDDLENPGKKAKIERVEYIQPGKRWEIGDIEISPFAIPHDAVDPVGYTFRAGGTKVAIVTDLGYLPEMVKEHLREADFLILESNHAIEKLKLGPYPWHIKQRVMSKHGHLSNEVVSEFLADASAFDAHARHVVLAHLSEQNNDPHVAKICAEQALGSRPADSAFGGALHIASQRIPLGPFDL
jgi:phosphoribosyl 1,2-cyclic phosphodiesterase